MSGTELNELIRQIKDAIKNGTRFEKDSIKKDINDLQEAWKKGNKSEVSTCAIEIKKKIEDKFGSHYMDLTKKLLALHKKVPDVSQLPTPKSSESADKLKMEGEKAKVHPRKANPKDIGSKKQALLKDLSEIRDILSNDALADSDDIQKLLTDIRSFSERVTAVNKRLLAESKERTGGPGSTILKELSDIRESLCGKKSAGPVDMQEIVKDIRICSKRVIEDNKKYQTESQTLLRKIQNKLSNLNKVFEDGTTIESAQGKGWDDICSEIEQIEKRVFDGMKSMDLEITEIEKEVKNWEKFRKLQTGKDIEQGKTNASKLKQIRSKLMSLKKDEEDALKKTPRQNDDFSKKLKKLEEKVKTVWTLLFKNAQSDNSTSSERMLSDIETKVLGDMKSLSSLINDIDTEVKNWEKFRQLQPGKDIEQGETNASKLKQIHTKLKSLKTSEEAALKRKVKQKDEVSEKIKLLQDKVQEVWSEFCGKGVSSDDTDTERMLSDIAKRQRQCQKDVAEQHEQTNESTQLLQTSIACIRSQLLNKPFKFEKPENYRQRDIKDFNDVFKLQLSLVYEIEDLINKNAESFSGKFVEKMVVVTHLKDLFFFLCKEELNFSKGRQISRGKSDRKPSPSKDYKENMETKDLQEMFETVREMLVERGITRETVEDLRNAIQETETKQKSSEREISQLMKEKSELKQRSIRTAERYENDLRELEKEKANLLTRLSKLAGANLTNNNPNIADLSDPKRPTKLADDYSELYDDLWTNAFEELRDKGKSEEDIVTLLLDIVTGVYKCCWDIGSRQDSSIRSALLCPTDIFMEEGETGNGSSTKDQSASSSSRKKGKEKQIKQAGMDLSAEHSKTVSELRKQTADSAAINISKYFRTHFHEWFASPSLDSFTLRCVHICWMMNVQTPPVYIEIDVKHGFAFDKNKYKEYTKAGKKVAFIVWPALFLHKGGPLLAKGVAQGRK